jgi:hypothetical protein
MAKYGQDDVFVLVDGYDISGDTFELSPEIEALLEQTDGFGDAWEEQSAVGVKRASVAHRSFYDDADDATAEALVGQVSPRVFTAGVEGNAQGRRVVSSNGILQRRSARGVNRGELHKISAEYEGAKMEDSTIIQSLAAESGAGVTSDGSHNFATALETGGTAYLQVTALTLGGYTSITVKLEHSPDDAVWADLATFTNVTAAPFAQAVDIVGDIDDFVRASLTLNGAGSGESITLLAALRRG